ncbi:spermidine/putrescine transport system permease protein [Ruminococcaceae bacterium YRB3002]|nr:spermidine/putrescine transport system permease protein [Ruminococcaceae bacterium YRB3002]
MVRKLKKALSGIYVTLIGILLYAPILVLIILSFNDSRSRVTWGGFTLDWYARLFANSQIMDALWTTVLLALGSAVISVLIGVPGAIGIHAMSRRGYRAFMLLTNIPMLNADIVTGIALMLWFVHFLPLGFGSVLLAHITFNIPYVILSVMPRLQTMNISVYEATRDLGAGPVYSFFKVLLPQMAGGILSGFFMAFTMSMDDFVITYFTKGAGINTLSTMIYGQIRKGIKPELYALSTLIFIIVLIILTVFQFVSGRRERNKTYKERYNE